MVTARETTNETAPKTAITTTLEPGAAAAEERIAAREGWATYPALAAAPDGVLWVAWLERVAGADALWLQPVGGAPRRLARAEAIKDGPALAWAAGDGLVCAWPERESREPQRWRLVVARRAEAATLAVEPLALDPVVRPSRPVLASDGEHLLAGCELHAARGSAVVVVARQNGTWRPPVALSAGGRRAEGPPEAAYDLTLAITPDGWVWAAWIEARQARHDVWVARVPVEQAAEAGAWTMPERIGSGPHFSAAPRLLIAGSAVWVAWTNYSGHASGLGERPWANGPERQWERILFATRRRVHVRRWVRDRGWGPEQREPEPAAEAAAAPWQSGAPPNSHWPVLFPVGEDGSAGGAVGLVCRRTLRTFRWTIEAHRLEATAAGEVRWSPATLVAGVDGSERDRAGGNMPVAVAALLDGRVLGAWQRHDRERTAPGFHFTMGTSEIVVAELPVAELLPATHASAPVPPATEAPALLRARPALRTVTIDGLEYRLIFGNLHRHAECSSCGRDANGPAELHMRHAPDINRNEFLAVTDHGEHLNDGEWREQCLLADFYTWPGHRVAFPGIEWTSEAPWHPPAHGHKNIIFSRSDLPFVDCWMPHSDHPERLWAWLAANDPQAVTIPHHMMRGKAPTLWEHRDDTFQPVVEIFQDTRGSSEWLGAPAATSSRRVQGLGLDPRGSVRRALDRGFRIGFIASSDHGGVALGGVYVREVSRAGILEALRARRCFATTGDQLLLDFRINGVFQGGEVTLVERPSGPLNQATPLAVSLRAEVLRPVRRVVLVRDGVEAVTLIPDQAARTIEHTWQVEGPFVGTSYFYVRIESDDGELAWSSPIWVTREWGV